MSLRIIVKPHQIRQWIAERQGIPARRHNSETVLRILFGADNGGYDPIGFDELIETMKLRHLSLLVDQEPGKTQHKFIQHS